MKNGNLKVFSAYGRKRRLAKETRSYQEVVECLLFDLSLTGTGLYPPRSLRSMVGGPQGFRLFDASSKNELCARAIRLEIAIKIAADLPCSWKLGRALWPSEVTKLYRVFALVCYHKGMYKAAAVIALRRPEAANTGLRVEQSHFKSTAWRIMQK